LALALVVELDTKKLRAQTVVVEAVEVPAQSSVLFF
jgi:hypothetical protein